MNKSNLYIFLGKVFHKRVFPKNHEFLYSYKSLYSKDILSFSNYSFYKQNDIFFSYDFNTKQVNEGIICLLYTSPSPRDRTRSRMPSSA